MGWDAPDAEYVAASTGNRAAQQLLYSVEDYRRSKSTEECNRAEHFLYCCNGQSSNKTLNDLPRLKIHLKLRKILDIADNSYTLVIIYNFSGITKKTSSSNMYHIKGCLLKGCH